MSQENVELLREMYRLRSLTEFADSLHPEAELHQARVIPDTDAYYGREEFVRGVSLWLEEWERFRYIPEDVIDLGERAIMRVRLSGRQDEWHQARPDHLSRLDLPRRHAMALRGVH
jgi:hypothetical protein